MYPKINDLWRIYMQPLLLRIAFDTIVSKYCSFDGKILI